ncbi:MAG: response regulator [Cytophagales bacterium]|nr:response regulator [Bernardetiaceae bacterium]MDW8203746.1 response regulator [Cytophagales bacterium]
MINTVKKFHSVMLIDDNDIDNLINQKMLESANICENIYTHSGAKSAIEFLKNMEKLSKSLPNARILPDLIFLDIDMPLMDGFQFLDQFDKLSAETKRHCQIIMLTSSINQQDVHKAKSYGYVKKYINKPLTIEEIRKLEQLASE